MSQERGGGSTEGGRLARVRRDPRRERTPQRLVSAARVVFERDGFHQARLADVTREANVSTGTLYNYFQSKEELFRAVMQGVLDELTTGADEPVLVASSDPVEGVFQANRAYIAMYRRHARLMGLLIQVGDTDREVRAIGMAIRDRFESRISRAIRRWQEQGLVWSDLDPVYTANALGYMVDRFMYEWESLDLEYDEALVAETLSKLWVRSLGLADGPRGVPPVEGRTRGRPRKAAPAGSTPA